MPVGRGPATPARCVERSQKRQRFFRQTLAAGARQASTWTPSPRSGPEPGRRRPSFRHYEYIGNFAYRARSGTEHTAPYRVSRGAVVRLGPQEPPKTPHPHGTHPGHTSDLQHHFRNPEEIPTARLAPPPGRTPATAPHHRVAHPPGHTGAAPYVPVVTESDGGDFTSFGPSRVRNQ